MARTGGTFLTLLAGIDADDDFQFDPISPIAMDHWTMGRVNLVGDAGYSPAQPCGRHHVS